jgi:5-methylcytosine-specific restriction enzyme B
MKHKFNESKIKEAIKEIDQNPKLIIGRQSSIYDLVYNGKSYPPILVLSVANELNGGEELKISDFNNNTEKAFKILRDLGFDVITKANTTKPNIHDFIKVASEQVTGQGTTETAKRYITNNKGFKNELKIEITFGVGRASAIPWIAFTGFRQSVKNGIYPVYLYYKKFKKLLLAYGVSEKNNPIKQWHLPENTKSVEEYLKLEIGRSPERYGNSFVFKAYDTNFLPSNDELEKDLAMILNKYISLMQNRKIEIFEIGKFLTATNLCGLKYGEKILKRFVSSCLTKPFVILTGLSGSGKTKLAQAFVQWICASEEQYKIVPVGADWTNREPLLGYPNGLDDKNYVTPDSGVLHLIIEASKEENEDKPFFLILDEMNLSHVERYFADFLSIMESEDTIKLYSGSERKDSNGLTINKEIGWPKNLFIIGTVNIDETTYMFSPKVLDRANVIEFRITADQMKSFIGSSNSLDMDALFVDGKKENGGLGQNMAADFMEKAKDKVVNHETENINILNDFFVYLQQVGAEFGYRSASEIELLLTKLKDSIEDEDDRIDIAIMQKLLPKLHGSRKKLNGPLETLAGLCLKEEVYGKDENGREAYKKYLEDTSSQDRKNEKIRFKLSFEKIERMRKNAIENGFTSYAEA